MVMREQEEIERHVLGFFSGHDVSRLTWAHGPTATLWPHVYFLAIAPGPKYSGWVYFTVGASQVATPRHEFFVCSPFANETMAELLAMVVHYHAKEKLGLNHTLPIGRPWLPNSSCDQLFVSLPYPFGPQLEHITSSAGEIQSLWLLPITQAERTFAKTNGADALESMFDAHAINPLDPARKSVV
jgi:hypothetical protein